MKYIFKFTLIPLYYLLSRLFLLAMCVIIGFGFFIWNLRWLKISQEDINYFKYLQIDNYYKRKDENSKYQEKFLVYISVMDFIKGVKTEIDHY